MPLYDSILVPTDGSREVEQALEHAFDLAATHNATIHALYVINAAGYGGLQMEAALEGIATALHGEGEAAVNRVEQLAPANVTVETTVRKGAPSQVIVDEADTVACDLVVMGTHGRGGIDRLLLGSVTERVVRRSPVPVLTVQVEQDDAENAAERSRIALK